MTKRKYVDVNVSWCYGECSPTAKVSLEEWERILKGEHVVVDACYWYEGKRYSAYFSFNGSGRGTLTVGYEDGGEGFIGRIGQADITGGEYRED